MNKFILAIIGIVLHVNAQGQNLVPNPSFEDTIGCPVFSGQIYLSNFWFQPNTVLGNTSNSSSSDYFNECVSSLSYGVPANGLGFQYARTGAAYAGILLCYPFPFGSNYREYLEIKLSQQLINGKKYCAGFYVSVADKYRLVTDAIGIYFSNDSVLYSSSGYSNLPYVPQVSNASGNILADTANWMPVSGEYVASGGEEFIIIGNFKTDVNTNLDTIGGGAFIDEAYYFIDDIFVIEMAYDKANAGGDKMICAGDSTQLGTMQCDGCAYIWTPAAGLSDATVAQPLAFPTQTTTYILTLTDTTTADSCICKNISITTDSVTVYADGCPPPPPEQLIEIYNIFTPNGDSKNDFFYIKNLPANSSLQIFNRWGSRVYESNNYNNKWDGGGVPDGTYYYILVLQSKEAYHGFVEIRR